MRAVRFSRAMSVAGDRMARNPQLHLQTGTVQSYGENRMNRSDLVAALADRAEVARKDADAVLTALAETIGDIVAKGDEKVTIPGFLSFERTHRAARTARNPQTGEPLEIPAGYSVKVSAGSKLKEAAKGK